MQERYAQPRLGSSVTGLFEYYDAGRLIGANLKRLNFDRFLFHRWSAG